ncbi:MAG: sugar ABC transporter permease [Treponema sp.]|jgi:multiple sugar transport system permease protein/sn-glycerol 3-phosphate transport system permease protein|nr:sugar ABC transporter permease [Treponema sp.]
MVQSGVKLSGISRMRGYFNKRKTHQFLAGYLFILPAMAGFIMFMFIPTVAAFIISFFDWNIIAPPIFKGLSNYAALFRDKLFWNAIFVTLQYIVYHIPASLILAFFMAIAMKQEVKGTGFFRTAFVVPWITTPVIISFIWKWILDPNFGAINYFTRTVFHFNIAPLVAADWFPMASIAIINMWIFCGYHMLVFTAGLGNIPQTLYEAATIDSANAVQQITRITIPLMRPTIMFALITSVIGSFQIFDLVFGLYQGGPGDLTRVYYFYIYQNAFMFYKMGYACTMAVILFVILVVCTLVQYLFFQRNMVTDFSS